MPRKRKSTQARQENTCSSKKQEVDDAEENNKQIQNNENQESETVDRLDTKAVTDHIPIGNGKQLDMILDRPIAQANPTSHYVVILTHGAGGDMMSAGLDETAKEICSKGLPVLRFTCKSMNFKYRLKCFTAVVDFVKSKYDFKCCYIGGRSMGSRVAAELASQDTNGGFIKGVISLAYPLHQAQQKSTTRQSHLNHLEVPLLFISGSKDPMCDMDLMTPILKKLSCPSEIHWITGADHSLKIRSKNLMNDKNNLSHIIYSWCCKQINS